MKKLLLFFMITLLPVLGIAQTLIDGIYYNLNSSDNTASVTNNSNGYYSGSVVIPEKVIYGGATYSVTSIGDNAFNNCTNLTNVSISNSVTLIGKGAFGKTSLKTLTVGTGVQQFDGQAFSGATQPIKTIWLTNTPPQNYSVAQGKINYVANKWTCKLFVPKGCVGAYQTADQWKEFFFIEEGEKLKTEIAINEENFPDENFRAFLKEQPYGGDGILTEKEIKSIKMINVSGKNIKSLEGIEFFTTLDSLACGSNQLTSLDVSKNTALTYLYCNYNQLTSLDVSKNTTLKTLECYGNQLTILDVYECIALTKLYCHQNQLTSLDVSKNTVLTDLSCDINQLTSLDVSKNTALTMLSCGSNQLTSLDVSKNTALTGLHCSNNQLMSLDVSMNTALTNIDCGFNQLTSLDVSNNTALTSLRCYRNKIKGAAMDAMIASLPIQEIAFLFVISLSDTAEGNVCTTNQVNAAKDKGWRVMAIKVKEGNYDYEGSDPTENEDDIIINDVSFPDENFRAYLTSQSYGKDGIITEEEIKNVASIDVSRRNITNLKGIEFFTALTDLYCYNNKIKGEAMDALIAGLPKQDYGKLYVIDLSNPSEGNRCSKEQVNIAKQKGWTVYSREVDGGKESYKTYEGSDQALDEDISGSCGDDVNYTYKKAKHILTISGSGAIFDYDYDSNKAPWSSYADEIQKIEIESGITSIGYFAFYKCSGITSLSIPATIGYIGSSAFEDCTSLTSLSLNEGLLSIGGSAFESCIGLKTLSIPSTVNSISINAFKNCKGITDVYCYAEAVPDTHFDAFDATPTEKSTLHVPANSVEAYRASWPWSDFKAIVPLGSSGDANGDGVVDDKDINAIVEFIMNGKSDGFNFNNADTNNDQKVNAADIVKIVNMIKK